MGIGQMPNEEAKRRAGIVGGEAIPHICCKQKTDKATQKDHDNSIDVFHSKVHKNIYISINEI